LSESAIAHGSQKQQKVDFTISSLLAVSDVMGTGWFAAAAANVKLGATVAVVGDGAVGFLGVLSDKQAPGLAR
jgi:threonine dehydrogenase-like Zn-dependent dehydrogenase